MAQQPEPLAGAKDPQLATPDGRVLSPTIDGVAVRPLAPILDARGELFELFSSNWPELGGQLTPHVYMTSVYVGITKGWIMHAIQTDRLALITGALRVVLYDDRVASPTRGTVKEVFGGERSRALVVIPPGVWHAVGNVGETEAHFLNAPDTAYNHADPDKYRLPLDTPLIPYVFATPNR